MCGPQPPVPIAIGGLALTRALPPAPPAQLLFYRGDYANFERVRAEELRRNQKAVEAADRKRAHVQAFIDKFRANAKRASLVQSRVKVRAAAVRCAGSCVTWQCPAPRCARRWTRCRKWPR